MQFVLYALDKENHLDVRMENRPDHIDFLKKHDGTDTPVQVLLAGPLRSDDGETMIGSVLVLEADNKSDIDKFAANDPYAIAGLFQSVSIHEYGMAPLGMNK